ncbi:MAG TPA: nucleotide sugar dehydrogenase [Victivallales bacterium]|nr:nucleotide sugar dehydrogenase [Victivallales bacterium]
MSYEKTVLCIGAGYVGGPTMAVIADKCPDYKIIVADINEQRIADWQTDELPIYEPGLLEVTKRALNRNLFFTTDVDSAIKEASIIFVSVNTPTKTFGQGAGKASNLQYWEKTARNIVKQSDRDKIIVEKSTLPVRTAEAMSRILRSNDKGLKFEVLSNPEFLAEGTAIADLENPDRVLVGAMETEEGQIALKKVVDIYANWVPKERIVTTNVWSSELTKLVANALLAQRISSINSISALCEKTDANVLEVSKAARMDTRIGAKFLNPSVGFGGSCFKKDVLNLVYLCEHFNLPEVARYWEQVVLMNEYQERRFVKRVIENMFNSVADKKITLFGFAFKADTGDTRESPAIYISELLSEEHANIAIHDPKALKNAKYDLEHLKTNVEYFEDPYEAAKDSHALLIVTEWNDFKDYDYEKLYKSMEKPAFVFDGRNILDHKKLFEIGFNVYPLGQQALTHLK